MLTVGMLYPAVGCRVRAKGVFVTAHVWEQYMPYVGFPHCPSLRFGAMRRPGHEGWAKSESHVFFFIEAKQTTYNKPSETFGILSEH